MAHLFFTRAEAQGKLGTRALARVAFAGVSEGAIGTMTGADQVIDGYDIEVTWARSRRRMPWVEWLSKTDAEVRLVELLSRGGSS